MNRWQSWSLLLGVACAMSSSAEVICGSSQYLPNPNDCGSYYECSNGIANLIKCPTGLEFSVTSNSCNYPQLAQCGSSNTGVTVPSISGNLPKYYCPEVDGTTAYIYPNPSSCSSYYMCAGGSLHLYQCQTGLEYSVEERGCDYPYRAKCDLNNLPSFPTGPTSQAPVGPTTLTSVGPTPGYYCPEVDGPTAYIYPNPLSCSSYYMCAGGYLHFYQCQTGLEYSVEERGCDYPDRAKCDLNNLPTFPTGPTKSSPIVSSTNSPVNVLCPANVETLVRDPTDCGKFYECNYGIPIRESCYPGLYFSEKNQACDYPQNVPECTST
ncbi:probable chitinase 10 [Bacillus rossius redtenbacheri]|uniref:probable chitinase 10 n=1 Tax=Bacillus rossius redtenbacheri TaxID=93214 RepID=UPI002FDEE663